MELTSSNSADSNVSQRYYTALKSLITFALRTAINIALIFIITVLFISANVETVDIAVSLTAYHKELAHIDNSKKVTLYKTILYTTDWKSGSRDTLKRYLDPIFTPIISKYSEHYQLPLDTLVAVIETMATSESGNSKGQPFSNSLFRIHNNPFGIKGIGTTVQTVEYYNGIRTVIHDGFQHFTSLEEAIDNLVGKFLMTERYEKVRNASTVEEFFTMLYECGYFTHPTWHKKYFIPTCKQYYL